MPVSTDIIIRPLAQPLPPGLGGTGQSTLVEAIAAMLPPQSGNSGRVLSTDGTGLLWVTNGGSGGSGTVTSVSVVGGPGISTAGGPITTSGTISVSLSDSGVTAGTYGSGSAIPQITVDSLGRVTQATSTTISVDWAQIQSRPTTLAGFGITDAAPLSHVGATGSAHGPVTHLSDGFMSAQDKIKLDGIPAGGSTGSVTSVNVSGGTTGLTFSGGPVTTQGTLTMSGVLDVPNGGTGTTSFSGLIKGQGSSPLETATPGVDYLIPTSVVYIGTTGVSLNRASGDITLTGTSISGTSGSVAGGSPRQILVQTSAGVTGFISAPSVDDTYLKYSAGSFQWSTVTSGGTGSVTSVSVSSADLDVTGSPITSTGTIDLSLKSVATAGTYQSVTINSKGLVTAGTNPTTLSGYGITDAQPLDGDLTAIAALTGSQGILRKVGVDSWSLDTASYLTSNQSITFTGDVTGSGSTSVALTLESVAAPGTYRSVTVDAKGRVTSGTNPTTLTDYGITDALSSSVTSDQLGYFGNIYLLDDLSPSHYLGITNSTNLTAGRMLSIDVSDSNRTLSLGGDLTVQGATVVSGTNTGDQTITLTGDVTGGGTGTFSATLANSGVTPGTYNSGPTTVTPLDVDVKGRITGVGAPVTITPDWTVITNRPTSLSGYGITDALPLGGGTLSGALLGTSGSFSSTVTSRSGLVGETTIGSLADGGISLGQMGRSTSGAPRIDFHSSINTVAYDVSLEATGGTSTAGEGSLTIHSAQTTATGNFDVAGNLIVSGDLTVSGTTNTVNSTVVVLDDPVLTLGGSAPPTVNDGRDRGIEFRWHDGTNPHVGFFGYDASTGKFTFIPDAVNTGEIFSGTKGVLDAYLSWADVQNRPTTLSGYGITDSQPLDGDLTAIAGLAGNAGFLKKTGTDAWLLDTSTYLTGNQSITISGDASGTGTTAISLTLANSGVTAGTYRSVTVDTKGRVTTGTNPTTLAGYGITDALSNSAVSTQDGYFGNIYLWDDVSPSHYLAITNSANLTAARTLSVNVNDADRVISLSGNLTVSGAATVSGTNTGDQTITLTGDVTGSGTGSFVTTLANSGVTSGTYNNSATAVTPLTVDSKGRVTSTGAAVTITPAFSSITGKPTTLSGYGITDAAPLSHVGSTGSAHGVATTLVDGFMSSLDKTKLDGVAVGATANSTDAQLRDRATHTGTQAISTVAGLQTALDGKQATLVSGTNIKTINGNSVLGAGNVTVGATGGSGNSVFWENDQIVSSNYTITAGRNAGTFGPVTVANGVTVTIPDGSVWTIV